MASNGVNEERLSLIIEGLKAGTITRRDVMAGIGTLALGSLVGVDKALAAEVKELVLSNWGGSAVESMDQSWGQPFTKDTGIKVVIDGSGPSLGKIKAMVESGKVTWDVCDSAPGDSYILGRAGQLEEIDYGIVDKTKTLPGFDMPWCLGISAYSFVLTYDTAAIKGEPPKNWVEFWDVGKFPGKRGLWHDMTGVLEAALMADGVSRDALYPIDVDRALKKVAEIKDHTIFWNSGSQSQQLLRDGEIVMGQLWSTRARLLSEETKGKIAWTWQDGLVLAGVLNVPKGNPAGKVAMQFLNSTLVPERQIMFLRTLGSGPSNPEAAAMVPPDLEKVNPTSKAALALQAISNDAWYADNFEATFAKYLEVIGG